MAAKKQTLGEFKNAVIERVTESRPELSKADINGVLNALVEQVQADLTEGFEVPLLGLVKVTPTAKKGRKKGTEVRNPFDGSTRKLDATEPDSVKLKAKPMAAAKAALPEAGSVEAKKLVKALA